MATAEELIVACQADVNRQPPLLYGQKVINGLSQRGPDSYDCIGMVRKWLLQVAPALWPTSWGGPDSWTVPNFYDAWKAHGLKVVDTYTPKPADIIVYFDSSGGPQHIGIADGKGNVYSALNTVENICLWPINGISWPTYLTLPTGLVNPPPPVITPWRRAMNFNTIAPARLIDTRTSTGLTKLKAGISQSFLVADSRLIPRNATAITCNIVVTNQVVDGFVYVGPDAPADPHNMPTSTLNFSKGKDTTGYPVVAINVNGMINVTSIVDTDFILDVTGYFN